MWWCHVCRVLPGWNQDHPHQVRFLKDPNAISDGSQLYQVCLQCLTEVKSFHPVCGKCFAEMEPIEPKTESYPVCEQCFTEMSQGLLTEFGGDYGYRGILIDGFFEPHTKLDDGTLKPIIPDNSGHYTHDPDINQLPEWYREHLDGHRLQAVYK